MLEPELEASKFISSQHSQFLYELQIGYLLIKLFVVSEFDAEEIGVIVSHLLVVTLTFHQSVLIVSQVVTLYNVLSLSLAHLSDVMLHPVDNVANCGFCCNGLTKFSCKACANQIQFFLA
jgi:hypothetical protein